MPPKARNGAKGGELKVAKRPNAGARTAAPAAAAAAAKKDTAATASAPSHSGPQEPRRVSSGPGARKVSDGLKQLPQAAYRFVRESYLMLDSDGSGSVSKTTMRDMLSSLGFRDDGDKRLDAMLERTGEPITFGSYLAVMGELLSDLPTREELDMMLEAFQRKDGTIDERDMRSALAEQGLTAAEIDAVFARFARPTRHGDSFDVKQFASALSI